MSQQQDRETGRTPGQVQTDEGSRHQSRCPTQCGVAMSQHRVEGREKRSESVFEQGEHRQTQTAPYGLVIEAPSRLLELCVVDA